MDFAKLARHIGSFLAFVATIVLGSFLASLLMNNNFSVSMQVIAFVGIGGGSILPATLLAVAIEKA